MDMKGDLDLLEATPHSDFADHEASVQLARALGGIGASPEFVEHRERMRDAIDQLRSARC